MKTFHIVFALPNTAALRFFEASIRELSSRGHHVTLALEKTPALDVAAFLDAEVVFLRQKKTSWTRFLDRFGVAVDYLRYAEPPFRSKPYLKQRMEKFLPEGWRWVRHLPRVPGAVGRQLRGFGLLLDDVAPVAKEPRASLRRLRPDVIVVSPLIRRGRGSTRQGSVARAGRSLGVPVLLAVGSWDHLSSKGTIRNRVESVLVWNDVQRKEAAMLHGVPTDRILTTGALPFDRWFDLRPTLTRAEFFDRVGLGPSPHLITYVGSSPNITPVEAEIAFVRRWLTELRGSTAAVANAGVMVRPHPGNVRAWAHYDLSAFGNVAIWPRQRPQLPMSALAADDFFHSLHFADVVVGVNTSAMIEAAVVGSPVCTIQTDDFRDTQEGTIHFSYLLPEQGGFALSSRTLVEHVAQVDGLLSGRLARPQSEAFVRAFVRPHGVEQRAATIMADTIEKCALRGMTLPPLRDSPWLRRFLSPMVSWVVRAPRVKPRTN